MSMEVIGISLDYTENYNVHRGGEFVWYNGIRWGLNELADLLKCSPNQVRAIISGGEIPKASKKKYKKRTVKVENNHRRIPSVCFKAGEQKSFRTRNDMAAFLGVSASALSQKIKVGGKIKGWSFMRLEEEAKND